MRTGCEPRYPLSGNVRSDASRAITVDAVQHLQARSRPRGGLHEPPEQRLRLGAAAKAQQGVDQERRVADPAEAIVPVADATDFLRQRRRRRGYRRAARGEDHQLERQRAPDHRVAPRTVIRARGRTTLARTRAVVSRRASMARREREHQRFAVRRRQDDQRALAGLERQRRFESAVLPRRRSRLPRRHRDGIATACRHGRTPPPPHTPAARAVTEPRGDSPLQRHRASDGLDRARDLTQRDSVGHRGALSHRQPGRRRRPW